MKTADWLQLSQLGYLLYLRMCHVPWSAQFRDNERFDQHNNQVKAMAELTNFVEALLSPTLDGQQLSYIGRQKKVAEWHFYSYMPREQHRLLAHALWHMAEQAVEYGPPTLYWMFPMERSFDSVTHASADVCSIYVQRGIKVVSRTFFVHAVCADGWATSFSARRRLGFRN